MMRGFTKGAMMKTRVISMLLALCVALAVISGVAYAATESGTCGRNLTWEFKGNWLTVSGTGEMYDYESGEAPWSAYRTQIRHIYVEDGVTKIGSHAFERFSPLYTIVICDTVTEIGDYAFYLCDNPDQREENATTVTLGKNIETIGDYAFYAFLSGHVMETAIDLPNIRTIGASAFGWDVGAANFGNLSESIEDIPQHIGNWNTYGESSKKLENITLTTENDRQQFVKFLLGPDYLEETDSTYKRQMFDKLYALLYTTNYRPDKLGGFKAAWPFLNNVKSGSKLINENTGIGDVNWYRSCQGCYAYANFANQFFFNQNNRDASAEKFTYYYHTFIGLDSVSQLKQEDIAPEQVKTFIEQFASPGEQIRFYHNAKGPLYTWSNMHSVLYLGENAEKTGFYALSYLGANSYSGLEIVFYDYSDFARNIGLRGADTLRILGNFRDPSNEVNYFNKYIKMDVHCPVEVAVTYDGEYLSSVDVENAVASFGTLTRNRENESIHLELIYRPDYDIDIWGIDDGTMDLSLSYIGENEVKDTRSFKLVPINETTNISVLTFDGENDTLLYLDPHNNGTEVEIWSAAKNEVSTGVSNDKMFSMGFVDGPDPAPTSSSDRNGSASLPSAPTDDPVVTEPTQSVPFIDVAEGSWYYDAVEYVTSMGLFNGTSETTFSPDLPMTRAMLVTVLYRLDGQHKSSVIPAFSDVVKDTWYTDAVAWAVEKEIVVGYSDGNFHPHDSITREQLAVMLWRYAGEPTANGTLDSFTDGGKASGYALDALCWAVEQGIITGKGGGILDPKGHATRAEVAAVVGRMAKPETRIRK